MSQTALTFLNLGSPTGLKFVVDHGESRALFEIGIEHAPGAMPFSLGLRPREGRELLDLQEAGRVDGAGPWNVFWRITWPLLSPTTYFLLFVNLVGSFKVFVPVYVFTTNTGGPNRAAETIGFYLYQQAFAFFHAGYAGAISVAFFVLILVLTGIQMRFFSRRVFYT